MKHRDLNAPPAQQMADIVRALKERAESSKTTAHGVKDMGKTGDSTWTTPEGEVKSVRRFAVDLDDTTAQAEALAEQLREAEESIAEATRIAERVLVVSPSPPADSVIGKTVWLSPTGHRYLRVTCEGEGSE